MIENLLLGLPGNVYKVKEKGTIESILPEIYETEALVINEKQMTPEKTVDNEVNEEQVVNSAESPTISSNDTELLPHDIDQPVDWKK